MTCVALQASYSALGYREGARYVKESDCIVAVLCHVTVETVKELIRFLRRDDETCDIRRQLGHAQILQKDLLLLLKQHHAEGPLFDAVIRLLVNLTQPVLVCFNNELPEEKTLRQFCLQVESHLQHYKEAFVDDEVYAVVMRKMTRILDISWDDRHEEDRLMLERLLILIRNVLHIPPDPMTEKRADDDASVHDQILWAMHVSGIEDVLLYVANSGQERELCLHILEIISLMFREQSAEVLAHAGIQRSHSEKHADERELVQERAKEKEMKRRTMFRFSTRHSNFGGTFIMKGTKSLSDADVVYHHPVQDAADFTFDSAKKRRRKASTCQPIKERPAIRRSTLSIRLCLREFCFQFLANAYNPLMSTVKDILVRQVTQELDETYYLWTLQFFMQFCRHHRGQINFICETMSMSTFHYIYNNLLRYYEMMIVERKGAVVWGRRLHLALKAFQELLLTLEMMGRSSDSCVVSSARVIKHNVFYTLEFRDIFVTLLKRYMDGKNSRTYLKDLVESTHFFLKMFEAFTTGNSRLIVQGKKHQQRKKRRFKMQTKYAEVGDTQLEDAFRELSVEISACIRGVAFVPENISPFDAASDISVDQQREAAMIDIHRLLRGRRCAEAIAVFRAASCTSLESLFGLREVWPDREQFGPLDITPDEELAALRAIFLAHLPLSTSHQCDETEDPSETMEYDVNEEKCDVVKKTDYEQEFDFKEYLLQYAKPDVVRVYITLAGEFQTNSTHTNHCLVRMLYRVGFELGLVAMLFQASLFRVFQQIMAVGCSQASGEQELHELGVHVIQKFSEVAQVNKKVFVEVLFLTGSKESLQITDGYDYNPGCREVAWTEQDDEVLISLFQDSSNSGVDHPHKDTVDLILENWTGRDKTRRQVIRHLKDLHLISSAKDLHNKRQSQTAGGSRERTCHVEQHSDGPGDCVSDEVTLPDSGTNRNEGGVDKIGDDDSWDHFSVDHSVLPTCASIADMIAGLVEEAEGVSVPIVPLSEENETAMEDSHFADFLLRLGLSPPVKDQEVFWRIPGDMSSAELQTMSSVLDFTEVGDLNSSFSLDEIIGGRHSEKVEVSGEERGEDGRLPLANRLLKGNQRSIKLNTRPSGSGYADIRVSLKNGHDGVSVNCDVDSINSEDSADILALCKRKTSGALRRHALQSLRVKRRGKSGSKVSKTHQQYDQKPTVKKRPTVMCSDDEVDRLEHLINMKQDPLLRKSKQRRLSSSDDSNDGSTSVKSSDPAGCDQHVLSGGRTWTEKKAQKRHILASDDDDDAHIGC